MTNKYIPQRRSMCSFHGTSEPATVAPNEADVSDLDLDPRQESKDLRTQPDVSWTLMNSELRFLFSVHVHYLSHSMEANYDTYLSDL